MPKVTPIAGGYETPKIVRVIDQIQKGAVSLQAITGRRIGAWLKEHGAKPVLSTSNQLLTSLNLSEPSGMREDRVSR